MCIDEDVPEDGKAQPGGVEGGSKAEQGQAPGEVDHWYEEVLQEPAVISINNMQSVNNSHIHSKPCFSNVETCDLHISTHELKLYIKICIFIYIMCCFKKTKLKTDFWI
jgi:hypothetical protein